MAPTAPKKRTTMRAKLARVTSSKPQPTTTTTTSLSSASFADTKRDRRQIKRSALLDQITSKHTSTRVQKRRRPSKKLVANLNALADALPELDEDARDEDRQPGKVRLKSLKNKPGALKRKEKLVRAEAKAIGLNMAYLSRLEGGGGVRVDAEEEMSIEEDGRKAAAVSTSSRWAALRAHISGTMEQNPAFLEKK